MANLDENYTTWNMTPNVDTIESLMAGVRGFAYRVTRDDDVAQNVSLVVLERLDHFTMRDPLGFTKWVSSIIRMVRLDSDRRKRNSGAEFDESQHTMDEHLFMDTSELPEGIREIADSLLRGNSIKETADDMRIKPATLRKKLERYRARHVSSSLTHIEVYGQ